MEKKLVLCDTNIFIHWFNGNIETIEKIKKIGIDNISISVVSVMELIHGTDNKQQLLQLQKKIKNYYIINFNQEISKLSMELVSKFYLSNNLLIPDAIIGATSIKLNLPLFTYNKKDFVFMPNIKLIKI